MNVNKLNETRLNKHQEHIESLVLFGIEGLKEIQSYIEKFIDRFSNSNDLVTTTKIDGSPSVYVWSHVDGYPDNSIALKSFVNGPQTAMSSKEEIDARYGDRPDMADKLKQALELSKYIPSGEAWQGDCLYTQPTLEEREIDGQKYLTFQPNKIIYAFSEDNPGYNQVKNADFGIAFHTIYKKSGDGFSQSFNVDTSRLQAPNNFYLLSPAISNSKQDDFDLKELQQLYTSYINDINSLISDDAYVELTNNQVFREYWSMFENKMLADNKSTTLNTNTLINDLKKFVNDKLKQKYDKKISTLKSDDAKERAKTRYESSVLELEDLIENNKDTINNIVKVFNLVARIKMLMWEGFKKAKQDYSTFYKSKTKGYFRADPEGIAMSDKNGNIVKLVDRSTFSSFNRDADIESGWEHNESFGAATQGADMGSYNSFIKVLNDDKLEEEASTPEKEKEWWDHYVGVASRPHSKEELKHMEKAKEMAKNEDAKLAFEMEKFAKEYDLTLRQAERVINCLRGYGEISYIFEPSEAVDIYNKLYGRKYEFHLKEDGKQRMCRIATTDEFDNGKVFFKYDYMSVDEAENKAKEASLKNPTKIYYVKFDDVMNPSSDLKWVNGKSYKSYENALSASQQKNKITEDLDKVAVVAVGRMNPPTIGHEKLVNKMVEVGNDYGVKPKLFLTHSFGDEKNPLSYESKLRWAKRAFGDKVEVVKSNARTILQYLQELYNDGYTDIVYLGSNDRIGGSEDVTRSILKYNGNPDKQGNLLYDFNSIKFEPVGVRSETSEDDIERTSATLVRRLAVEKNFEEFKKYVPFNERDAKNLFDELRYALRDDSRFVEEYLKEINKELFEASLLTKNKLKKEPEMIDDLENALDTIDRRLDVPDLNKGLDDYRIDNKDYQGMFVKQGSKDVISFSPKDVANYAENELNINGDKVVTALDNISVEDSRGNEYDLYKSKSTLNTAKGGVTWNDKVEITYYQECIQLLLLTKYMNYPGDFIEWLKNSDRTKESGIFEYVYPFSKTKVKDESLFKQYWDSFVKSYSKTFNLCIDNSGEFISKINNILNTSGSLIPIHGGIKASYSNLAEEVLAGNDKIDKSDGYVVSNKDKSKISKILNTMVSLKGNAVDYVKYIESAPIVGVSLKKSEKSIAFDFNEEPITNKDVKELSLKVSENGAKILFNLGGEETSLDLRSAGDVKKIEFRPKGKAAYGNAIEGLKRVLGDRFNKISEYMKAGKYSNAAKYLISLLCGEKAPKENTLYKMTGNGAKAFAEIFNFSAGRPLYDENGNRITAPYMKVH